MASMQLYIKSQTVYNCILNKQVIIYHVINGFSLIIARVLSEDYVINTAINTL